MRRSYLLWFGGIKRCNKKHCRLRFVFASLEMNVEMNIFIDANPMELNSVVE